MTRQDIEAALDSGKLYVKSRGWRCRRNGATKLWKREPDRFSIPVKAGFRDCGRIEPGNVDLFIVKEA